MRNGDNPRIKNYSHSACNFKFEDPAASTCNFENQIVFDYHIKNSLYPQPKTKEKKTNEEGWQQFFMLCFGLLFLPSLAFSAQEANHVVDQGDADA